MGAVGRSRCRRAAARPFAAGAALGKCLTPVGHGLEWRGENGLAQSVLGLGCDLTGV